MQEQRNKAQLAATIDHTLLKPDAMKDQITKLCDQAIANSFAAVCVNPFYIEHVAERLKQTKVQPCTVIGFPLGANTSFAKSREAHEAVGKGAREIDMVINIGALKAGEYKFVLDDISSVVNMSGAARVKVIIETCFLTDDEKKVACEASARAGAHYVKTSTGFGSGGATAKDIKLMRSVVGNDLKIKASGGIRTLEQAQDMLDAGAARIGTSSGIAIIESLME
ncbi:MAG: deoxyribose-phosphate aldolase [Desulfobacteraceae bacterium]|nr:deoxyribose-phosphate aldolase [Desulfobacteraceae bacterium]